jgi:predicted nucleic acid-binding protein
VSGVSLDAGALIAIERGDAGIRALLREAVDRGLEVHVIPEVVAQVWRGGPRQARLATVLLSNGVETPAYDIHAAREVGGLCGATGTSDVVDAHVAWHAHRHDHLVATSDPDDIRALVSSLRIFEV